MATRYAQIVAKRGSVYSDGRAIVYQLRGGQGGSGRVLYEHEVRGALASRYNPQVSGAHLARERAWADLEHWAETHAIEISGFRGCTV